MEKTYTANLNTRDNHHFDMWIQYEPGCGGNFLAYEIVKNHYEEKHTLFINQYNNEYSVNSQCLLKGFYEQEVDQRAKFIVSHKWHPRDMTSQNISWDRLFYIQDDVFVKFLLDFKRSWSFSFNDSVQQYMIAQIARCDLQKHTRSKLHHYQYGHLRDVLASVFDTVWKKGMYCLPVYEWQYHIMVTESPFTLIGFKNWYSDRIEKILDSYVTVELNYEDLEYEHIDYKDLFVTKQKTLPGVMTESINNYNRDNLTAIRKTYPILTNRTQDRLESLFTSYFQ